MKKTISIDKDKDHFFIAICKQGKHSFLMLGIYDQNQVTQLLCRVGKFFDVPQNPKDRGYCDTNRRLCNALFSSSRAKIMDERLSRETKGEIPISYQAYDLSYQHYLEFIQHLESLQTDDNKYKCYKPIAEKQGKVHLKLTRELIFTPQTNSGDIADSASEVSINNTCRHTAIKLIEEVQHTPISSLVSSSFLRDLPYQTRLDYGQPSAELPFYVLPPSPAAYPDLSEEKRSVMTKLYARMERVLLIDPHSVKTQNKFQCLKDLYTEITGPQKDLTLDELLFSIQSWKQANESILNGLREKYFWDYFFTRQSATSRLITEIEQDLERAQFNNYEMN
ncbi:hypothetical protein [Legionella maioricensis]|uniref:Uncharacterized protein n=1 Tax=Legionella maioricensis TaxID=2896528 RepID=A0A9X2CYM3_9GAMM|nr:hypothetical protein [Legionella maioricensis]MCL9682692.1 hypothetical protein [Legionella maioricensis]MCL9687261.1 hypothetical protein [Legionella maioricensis]